MNDYASDYVGKWRAGEAPHTRKILATVAYDQTTHAYVIPAEEREQFAECIADVWTDLHPRAGEIIQREIEAGESAETALEEADVDVRFRPLADLIKGEF